MDQLRKMTENFPKTHYWNDSCDLNELKYSLQRGASGATTNPVIVKQVLEKNLDLYSDFITSAIAKDPCASEDDIAWITMEKMASDAAALLKPFFDGEKGKGRISIQTNPKHFNNAKKLIEQTLHFHTIAPNIQVKIPITKAGLAAIKECTARGVSINATVSFSVPQALAAADQVEKGLNERRSAGLETKDIDPVITIMAGRLDDWLKYTCERDGKDVVPESLDWAGIACIKKAYRIFSQRNYSSRILVAAYRHQDHWIQFMGGDLSMTIPYNYQLMFNSSHAEIKSRIDDPVPESFLEQLMRLDDFKKAYNKMDISEFDSYGPVNKTLDQFLTGYDELIHIIRKFMITF